MKTRVTKRQLNNYSKSMKYISEKAQKELAQVYSRIKDAPPQDVRNAMLVLAPAIVEKYGALSAQLAEEFFGTTRDNANVKKPNNTVVADNTERTGAIKGSIRWAAGELFNER